VADSDRGKGGCAPDRYSDRNQVKEYAAVGDEIKEGRQKVASCGRENVRRTDILKMEDSKPARN